MVNLVKVILQEYYSVKQNRLDKLNIMVFANVTCILELVFGITGITVSLMLVYYVTLYVIPVYSCIFFY